MATKSLFTAKTAEEATGVEWDSDIARRHGNEYFMAMASNLTAAETAGIEMYAGNDTWITYDVSGTPLTLTATQPHQLLPAGPLYRFKKTATVSACTVTVAY